MIRTNISDESKCRYRVPGADELAYVCDEDAILSECFAEGGREAGKSGAESSWESESEAQHLSKGEFLP